MSQNLIFGLHAVQAVLNTNPARIKVIYVQSDRQDERMQEVLQLAKKAHLSIQHVTKKHLDQLDATHQGIAAEVTKQQAYNENDLEELLNQTTTPVLLLILDGVTDPHNLGACLRSADAAGVHAVIAPKDKAVGLTPVVHKVACGAAEIVPFVQVTNLARTMAMLQERGIWLYGTDDQAEQSLYQQDLTGNVAIVMGAEGEGLRRLTREHCDYLVSLPMQGTVSSLNVSVASGVCLFEVVRQRMNKSQ